MNKLGICLLAGVLTTPFISLSAAADENWRLMSRHGGCASLQSAAKRKSVFDGINGPDDFIARLNQRGIAYDAKEEMIDGFRTIALRAPSLSLSVFFVPLKFCSR